MSFKASFEHDAGDGEGPCTYWLTGKFWEGDDSCIPEDAHLFDDSAGARRAIALHMLTNDLVDPWDYEITSTAEFDETIPPPGDGSEGGDRG